MKILVVGSGGREDALTWKIAQSPWAETVYCAPGNPGMARYGACVDIGVNDIDALAAFAKAHGIALTVVGPEEPLARGIVDRFEAAGLRAFGPSRNAAQLEASKTYAKTIMARYGIPTGASAEFDNPNAAEAYIKAHGAPIVVKADGLAAGKGVTVARSVAEAVAAVREALIDKVFGGAGNKVLIEDCLVGEEASILAFADGKTVVPMVSSQDHKAVYDGDLGPNTGGMGAYSPAPVVTPELAAEVERTVLRPCIEGMAREGIPYKGVLYAGLMITPNGPKVIEFNCRFGDPETQVVLPRMTSDLVPVLMACCDGTLERSSLTWDSGACVSVVMASGGYPKEYRKGIAIHGIDAAEREAGVFVFHAGTAKSADALVTNGGRVLNVTATGPDIATTIEKAYSGVKHIHFDAAHYRTDIGYRALQRQKTPAP